MIWKWVLLLAFLSSVKSEDEKSNQSQNVHRLSGTVKPTFYYIKFRLNPDDTFTGEVFIHIKVESLVESIQFHSSNLTIKNLYFDTQKVSDKCSPDSQFAYDFAESDLIRIFRCNKKLIPPETHVVHIKYLGNITDNTGLSKQSSNSDYILATDFTPDRARQVFPSFDEPGFKAGHQLNVAVPDGYVVLSNTQVLDKFKNSDGVVYKFESTPPMPIFGLSFIITQRSYTEYVKDKVSYKAYCAEVDDGQATQSLQFASKVIEFYSEYTTFKYIFPKIDVVELNRPGCSATNNWGLITINESLFCTNTSRNYRPPSSDFSSPKHTVAHELAHFWFGNLVTNSWWNDVWLHDGLSSFLAIKAIEYLDPNFDNPSDSKLDHIKLLTWIEVQNFSVPVVNFQKNLSDVRTFDPFTHLKPASLLLMTEQIIGADKIRKVIREYVKKYAYETVSTNDFLTILSNVAQDVNVRDFFETYLYQSRFPIVYVEEDEKNFIIKQKSISPKKDTPPSFFDFKWTIPVTYITGANNTFSWLWFHKEQEKLIIPKHNSTWIKLNYQELGYYRANYSEHLFTQLFDHSAEIGERFEKHYHAFATLEAFEFNKAAAATK